MQYREPPVERVLCATNHAATDIRDVATEAGVTPKVAEALLGVLVRADLVTKTEVGDEYNFRLSQSGKAYIELKEAAVAVAI